MNVILNTDSYKLSHFAQYPSGTKHVSSYISSRGIADAFLATDPNFKVVHFGLQAFIRSLQGVVVTPTMIIEASALAKEHGMPFNEDGWWYIVNHHNGRLPIEIQALPEGTVIDPGVVQVQIKNTDPVCYWLPSYLETSLLRAVWYPSTVASISRYVKTIIKSFLTLTCDNPNDVLPFRLHDFGARGVSSEESAELGGMAHLVNFMGTDTISGILAAKKHYNAEIMPGFSIPAAEHSTITSWGKENEAEAYRNMLKQFGGQNKMLAVVSDSYDIYNACENIWGNELHDEVIASGATVVVRPDSGDPLKVTQKVIEILGRRFGTRLNQKGYKVLHPSIRIIQVDGVTPKTIASILSNYEKLGWSAENIAFGMGGALLQRLDRDTLRYAMKTNAIMIGDKWTDVYKKPLSDPIKQSLAGRQAVIKFERYHFPEVLKNIREDDLGDNRNELVTVFEDGEVKKTWNFEEVRENAKV